MRSTHLISMLGAISLAFLPGCSTTPSGGSTVTPERAGAIARLAAWTGCTAATLSDPDSRPTWTAARNALAALEAAEDWDAATLSAILQDHGISQLVGDEGALSITAGILLVDVITGQRLDISSQPHVRAVLTGIRSGLDLALGATGKDDIAAAHHRLRSAAIATR